MSATLERTKTAGIYKRGSRYCVIFRGPDGKQHKRSAPTLTAARALKNSLSTDVARGEYTQLSRVRWGEYVEGWLDGYQGRTRNGVRPATVSDYRKLLERHATPYFRAQTMLTEITPVMVEGFTKHVAAKGLGPNSVRLALGPVRAALGDAVRLGLIRSNPALGVRVSLRVGADGGQQPARALTDEELARLVAAVPDQWRSLVVLLSETGLRISEAIALRWSDVDLGRQRLDVSKRIYRGQVAAPKSRYGTRSVPLSDHVCRELWQRRAGAPDAALVFPNRDGGYLDPGNMHGRWLKKAARAAGVEWAGFHTLRHTCATNLFRLGVNAKQAQVWLGHHSPAFTLAVYTHLLPDDLPASPFQPPEGGNRVVTGQDETGRDADPVEVAETA